MRKDLISSLILLGIAAAYYASSTDIQDSSLSDEVGPRGLPMVLTVLLVGIALVIGARALLAAPVAQVESDKDASAKWYRSAGLLAITALYIPLADYLGYWPALFLLLLAVPLYEGVKLSWRPFVIAGLGATFFYILFDIALGVRQPTGVLF
jgi:hypothetical protein